MADYNPTLQWDTTIASGSLDHVMVNERKLWAAIVEMDYGYREIWWTDDGTSSGANIFGDMPPSVQVIATEGDRRLWSQYIPWGGIWPSEVDWARGAFMFETERVSGKWRTKLQIFGRASENYQDGEPRARTFVIQALGTD